MGSIKMDPEPMESVELWTSFPNDRRTLRL